jgi:hypothetical protein
MWAGLDRNYHFQRIPNLRKLGGRRKTFERGREDGARFNEAGC